MTRQETEGERGMARLSPKSVRIVVAELDGDIILHPTLDVIGQLIGGIVLIEHTVDALFRCDPRHDLVRRLLHIALQMARDVDAGDLVTVALGKGNHLIRAAPGLHGEGRVDVDLMCRMDRVEHTLELLKVRKRLTAREHKVTFGRDAVHHGDAVQNLLHAETLGVSVFLFVDAERAVVAAIVRHKYRHGRAARACLIGMAHIC